MQFTLLLLYLGARLGTAYYHSEFTSRHDCYINEGFTSPYIMALQHDLSTISGCSTNQTSPSSNKEVHVITVSSKRRSGRGNQRGRNVAHLGINRRSDSMTIHIKPRDDTQMSHDHSVVVVLWSADPLVWKISTRHISNTSRYLFVLPKSSRLRNDGSFPIHVKVKKYNMTMMPTRLGELMEWTRKRFGVITSANKLPHTDIVQLLVGTDPQAHAECRLSEPQPGGALMSAQAVRWKKENTSACAAKWNEGYDGKDVHIVEVHNTPGTPVPGDVRGHIVLVITAEKLPAPAKQVDLVLKAPPGTSWTIDITKFKGNLRIITNAEDVKNEGSMRQTVSMTSEPLEETGQHLMNWVAESYGHPVSYTEANIADKFILYVDGGEKLSLTIRLPQDNITPTWPSIGRDNHRYVIQQAKAVSCTDDGMSIALPKVMLKNQGIGREHLSLREESCEARDNSTHLILSTNYDQCGTQHTTKGHTAIYTNMIKVRLSPSNNAKRWSDTPSNSAMDVVGSMSDELEGSGSGFGDMQADDTFVDDEDLHGNSNHDMVTIEVSCEIPSYRAQPVNAPIVRTHVPNYDYRLQLYMDEDYTRLLDASEKNPPRFQQGQMVFVEAAAITTDVRLRPMLKSCVVSPAKYTTDDSHKLIEKGCVRDNHNLELMADGPRHEQRFKLEVLDYWQDAMGSMFYIVCQLAMCTESIDNQGVPMCVNQAQYCFLNNMGSDNQDPAALAQTKFVASAPMLVIKPMKPGEHIPGFEPSRSEGAGIGPTAAVSSVDGSSSSERCERIVRVEGLDSGTVVGIAFAAFIIGVLLTAALWFIHTHTGPLGRRSSRPRSAETSGESTPSSTAPITIHQVNRFNTPMAVYLLNTSPHRAPHGHSAIHHLVLSPILDKFYNTN